MNNNYENEIFCFRQYENFKEKFKEVQQPECLIVQYKILFRNWRDLSDEDIKYIKENMSKCIFRPRVDCGVIKWEKTEFTIKDIVCWNAGYINKANILDKDIDDSLEKGYYTEYLTNDKSILDVFFLSEQPMLDVTKFDVQQRASRMINDACMPNYHLIFDEVGTGKTVSALYCIRDVVSCYHKDAKILVICPNNKKSEWQKDIKRQLGLYAHIVENAVDDNSFAGNIKEIYFKENEPAIYVEGQKKDQKNDGLDEWGDTRWNLVVIDEGHQCFNNYEFIKAERCVLLTATPIVINSRSRSEDGILLISNIVKIRDYVILLSKIVDGNKVDLSNLFTENSVFTQLFREDLGIIPKKRNIRHIICTRWDERNHYLDVLEEVKGGMTRLIYEQDDEMLVYGIFDKFKEDIKKAGYIIDESAPTIENTKQDELIKYLDENRKKSYIIFFNSKWPAKKLYERFVTKNMDNTVIAVKFGGNYWKVWPIEKTVATDNVFDYLQGQIEFGKRVLFITTGASGGTGLNLGKFDGVVNYELPFTSIELEQRFGRVDRMDSADKDEKEMVFIFNDDSNPILRYALLKINKTCEYMPVRNTILFCKVVIDFLTESLKKELTSCELEQKEKDVITEYVEKYKMIGEENQCIIGLILAEILKKRTLEDSGIDLDDYEKMTQIFIQFIEENVGTFASILDKAKKVKALNHEIIHWCGLIGVNEQAKVDMENDVNAYTVADEDTVYDEYKNIEGFVESSTVVIEKKENKRKEKKLNLDDIDELWRKADFMLSNLEDSSNYQIATGLFYISNGKYCRETVEEYRNKMDWRLV